MKEDDTVNDLQLRLQVESKIPVANQELLLSTGLSPDPSKPAKQCASDMVEKLHSHCSSSFLMKNGIIFFFSGYFFLISGGPGTVCGANLSHPLNFTVGLMINARVLICLVPKEGSNQRCQHNYHQTQKKNKKKKTISVLCCNAGRRRGVACVLVQEERCGISAEMGETSITRRRSIHDQRSEGNHDISGL